MSNGSDSTKNSAIEVKGGTNLVVVEVVVIVVFVIVLEVVVEVVDIVELLSVVVVDTVIV
jgi:hypothetical protein